MDRIGLAPMPPAPPVAAPGPATQVQRAPGIARGDTGGTEGERRSGGPAEAALSLKPLPGPEPPTGPPPAFDANLIEAESRRLKEPPPLLPPADDTGATPGGAPRARLDLRI